MIEQGKTGARVNCRVGSSEIKRFEAALRAAVNCRVGSSETRGLTTKESRCRELPGRQLRNTAHISARWPPGELPGRQLRKMALLSPVVMMR